MRIALALICLLAAAPAFGQTPSIKKDFEDAGHDVKEGVKGGYEKTKDATVHTYDKAKEGVGKGYDKAKEGVGTGMEKTGEGFDKAGKKIEGAGEDLKKDVE